MQTKKRSFKEAAINTLIGFVIAIIFTPIAFKICGVKYNGVQLGGVTLIMTVVSIVRSYIIRRVFNKGDRTGKFVNEYENFEDVLSEQRRICAAEFYSVAHEGVVYPDSEKTDKLYSSILNARMPK